jgi:hypothetical protein
MAVLEGCRGSSNNILIHGQHTVPKTSYPESMILAKRQRNAIQYKRTNLRPGEKGDTPVFGELPHRVACRVPIVERKAMHRRTMAGGECGKSDIGFAHEPI